MLWLHPCPAERPPTHTHYIKVIKPNYSWPVIHPVVSLASDQGHYTFLYGHTKHNQEGGRMNKHGLGSAPSARKRSLWHCAFFSPATSNADILRWFYLLTASCVLLWTATSRRLVSPALHCQLVSLSSLGPSFPPPLLVSREISPSGPLCGFHAKTDRDSDQRQHKRKWMLPIVSQCYYTE